MREALEEASLVTGTSAPHSVSNTGQGDDDIGGSSDDERWVST